MRCPKCRADNTKVQDTRLRGGKNVRHRRRVCPQCDYAFSTTEVEGRIDPDTLPLLKTKVVKKNGDIESFDRDKLAQSIVRAMRHAPVDKAPVPEIVAGIEEEANAAESDLFDTRIIGERVLAALKKCDKTAFYRYAVVHLPAESIADFARLLDEIKDDKE